VTTILVIDDDSGVREFLGTILDEAGYRVLTAGDGDQGLEIFRDKKPDLVITDIVMPRKGGIETIIEMRRVRLDANIIAISGGSREEPDVLRVALLLGACDVLAKPFGAQDLLTHVHR
jgi:DNA-binding response OmpR family regulator